MSPAALLALFVLYMWAKKHNGGGGGGGQPSGTGFIPVPKPYSLEIEHELTELHKDMAIGTSALRHIDGIEYLFVRSSQSDFLVYMRPKAVP